MDKSFVAAPLKLRRYTNLLLLLLLYVLTHHVVITSLIIITNNNWRNDSMWVIKTHQNTFVDNFSKCWPILVEIGVQCLDKLATQYD